MNEASIFNGATDDPCRIAVRAYVWGYAPILATRLRQGFTQPSDPFATRNPAMAGAPLNSLGHQVRLADASLRLGVAPNIDTLYSLAWIDLQEEPFVFETPDFGSRYYTFQMGCGDSSCTLSPGARTHGRKLPAIFITGPRQGPDEVRAVPEGMLHVHCHTRFLLLAGRVLVQPADPGDYARVHALQKAMTLRPLSRYLAGQTGQNPVPSQWLLDVGAERIDPAFTPLNQLGNVLREWVIQPGEKALVDSFRAIGISPEEGFRPDQLNTAAREEVLRGLADGADLVEKKTHALGRTVNGWTINYRGPEFGDDYLLRAAVAKDQIYVVPPQEALYPVTKVDDAGLPLTGTQAYRMFFARDQLPPAGAFWSLTLYTRDGPLVDNPINRYAIGDRTPGLVRGSDGSLEIRIQHAAPNEGQGANWLPAPAGPFHLMMRIYWPDSKVLQGQWTPPPVERVPAAA